jgi:AcrR family transcriptional regulator
MYDVATSSSRRNQPAATPPTPPRPGKQPRKTAAKVTKAAAKATLMATSAASIAERLDHLDSVDVWTRGASKTRQPRLTRDKIASAALRIADEEGLDALSMRRLAAELDVGTMSLYHYVKTKDELFTLVLDELLGEVLVPHPVALPRHWREAMTLIAHRTRAALQRHPWALDIADEPPISPNAIRHFDQALQALASLDAALPVKLDLLTAVDEYVFGYCLQSRTHLNADTADNPVLLGYVQTLLDGGDYPTLRSMIAEVGAERLWTDIHSHLRDASRFDRNLSRLLDGFTRDVNRRTLG